LRLYLGPRPLAVTGMESLGIDAIIDDRNIILRNPIGTDNFPLYLLRDGQDLPIRLWSKLKSLNSKDTAVIETESMPEPAQDPFSLSHLFQEYSMGSTTAPQDILRYHSPETYQHVASVRENCLWTKEGEA